MFHKVEEGLVKGAAFFFQDAGFCQNAMLLQDMDAFSGYFWVGIQAAYIHLADFALNNDVCAGRGFPVVAAGFQIYIEVCARGIFLAVEQGVAFCVEAAIGFVVPSGDDPAIFDNHTAHHGVGGGAAFAFAG